MPRLPPSHVLAVAAVALLAGALLPRSSAHAQRAPEAGPVDTEPDTGVDAGCSALHAHLDQRLRRVEERLDRLEQDLAADRAAFRRIGLLAPEYPPVHLILDPYDSAPNSAFPRVGRLPPSMPPVHLILVPSADPSLPTDRPILVPWPRVGAPR